MSSKTTPRVEEFLREQGEDGQGLRTRGIELSRVRPIRWLWERRIPAGFLSLLVAEEGGGKGTLAAWVAARATRGELAGDYTREPVRVLIIGDEDSFDRVWVPRLYAAGADWDYIRTLDDGEYLDDLRERAGNLAATIRDEQIGLTLLDALLDHVSGGENGAGVYNPKNIRQSLLPLRRIANETETAALGLMHPIKGNVTSFRQLLAGSHQFNAISRSSLLLGQPDEDDTRTCVRGKGNHSADPRSFEFRIVAERIELNGYTFEVPRVADERQGDRTVRDLLNQLRDEPPAPVRNQLAGLLLPVLTDDEQGLAELARAVDRERTDGSVRRALGQLVRDHKAVKGESGWRKSEGVPVPSPVRGGTARHDGKNGNGVPHSDGTGDQ